MVWIARPLDERLATLLGSDGPRLVTVYGIGGAGASSLVARVLPNVLRVDLSGATRASSVWARLRDVRTRVLWLDQVHRSYLARPAVERWLARGEGRVVVSAREPLGLPEEHRFAVDPLDRAQASALLEGELARFGLRRPEDLPSLVDLLDGWPLALRAAAVEARVHGFTRAALERLHEASADVRHVLEQSWNDLGVRERGMLSAIALAHASVATADAVSLVAHGHTSLARLVDRRWVHVSEGEVRVPRMVAAYARAHAPSSVGVLHDAKRVRARLILAAGERARAAHRRDPATASAELERLHADLVGLTREKDARTSVAAALILEPLLVGRLARDEVLGLWQRMTHVARRLPSTTRANVALALTRTLIHRGDHESAERVLVETKAIAARPVTAIYRSIYLGHLAAWRGLTDEATALLDAATRDTKRSVGLTQVDARALTEDALAQRAFVAFQRDDLDETERLARECASLATHGPSPRLGAMARRLSAEVLLRRGEPAAAVPLFTLTRDELFRFGDQAGALFVWSRLVEALCAAGDDRGADEARTAAALAARSGEGQLELSVLPALDRTDVSPPRVSELGWRSQIPSVRAHAERWLALESSPRPVSMLRLDPRTNRAWLSDRSVTLARRQTLWRILRALVEGHGRASTLTNAALFSAGWPGERAEPASQKQRVHTAIWTLRRLLFGALLETRAEGYAIGATVHVGRTDASPDGATIADGS